jgi:hypothetical protein
MDAMHKRSHAEFLKLGVIIENCIGRKRVSAGVRASAYFAKPLAGALRHS